MDVGLPVRTRGEPLLAQNHDRGASAAIFIGPVTVFSRGMFDRYELPTGRVFALVTAAVPSGPNQVERIPTDEVTKRLINPRLCEWRIRGGSLDIPAAAQCRPLESY